MRQGGDADREHRRQQYPAPHGALIFFDGDFLQVVQRDQDAARPQQDGHGWGATQGQSGQANCQPERRPNDGIGIAKGAGCHGVKHQRGESQLR